MGNVMIELNEENFKDKHERDKWKAFSFIIAIWSYILITIAYVMYDDVKKQDVIIENQVETISILMEDRLKWK